MRKLEPYSDNSLNKSVIESAEQLAAESRKQTKFPKHPSRRQKKVLRQSNGQSVRICVEKKRRSKLRSAPTPKLKPKLRGINTHTLAAYALKNPRIFSRKKALPQQLEVIENTLNEKHKRDARREKIKPMLKTEQSYGEAVKIYGPFKQDGEVPDLLDVMKERVALQENARQRLRIRRLEVKLGRPVRIGDSLRKYGPHTHAYEQDITDRC